MVNGLLALFSIPAFTDIHTEQRLPPAQGDSHSHTFTQCHHWESFGVRYLSQAHFNFRTVELMQLVDDQATAAPNYEHQEILVNVLSGE